MKMKTCVLAAWIVMTGYPGFTSWVMASEKDIRPTDTAFDELVVTATRYGESLSGVPAHITVIDRSDIDHSTAANIPDLLNTQVGLKVTDLNSNRKNYRVDIRGFGETAGSNTLVLVDGRRINQADLSGTDWTLIPLDRVDRIEIIRGGRGSVLYGDNASGGVINIITQKGGKFATGAKFSAGSYDSYKGSAYVSGYERRISYAFNGSYTSSDGYRNNSGSEVRDLGANLNYSPVDSFQLPVEGGYHKDRTRLPGALKESDFLAGASRTDTVNPNDFAETEDYYISTGPCLSFLDDDLFKIDMSLRRRDFLSFSSFAGGEFMADAAIKTMAASPQLLLKNNPGGFDNTLVIGADFISSNEDISNKAIFFGFPSEGDFTLKKENAGYYAHDEIKLTDLFALSGGLRHDRAVFKFKPSILDRVKMDENLFTAGINYRYQPESQLFFSYSKSFRYPVLDEMFNFFKSEPNPTLTPQTSGDYEIGVRHAFDRKLSGTLTLFRIETDDEIFYNPVLSLNENYKGETVRSGLEASVTRKFEVLEITGSYTYTMADIEEGLFEGETVPGIPKHKATLEAVYAIGRGFTISANGTYTGKRYFESDFPNDFGKQEDYFVTNAKVGYERKNLSAYVQANNLTDEEYSEYGVLGGWPVEKAYYPSAERNFMAGISIFY